MEKYVIDYETILECVALKEAVKEQNDYFNSKSILDVRVKYRFRMKTQITSVLEYLMFENRAFERAVISYIDDRNSITDLLAFVEQQQQEHTHTFNLRVTVKTTKDQICVTVQ
jgi:hypothetical protein